MANFETSFRDRETKSTLLRDTVAGFTSGFAPTDSELSIVNFSATIAAADAANLAVEALVGTYSNNATSRMLLLKAIRTAVTQAIGYVKSNRAWATQFKAVKVSADKLRGVRPSSNTEPASPPAPDGIAETSEKSRNKGSQAYATLAAHFEAFIAAITACAGYAPPASEISIATFSAQLSQFKGLNTLISNMDGQLTREREKRLGVYFEGTGCLKAKFSSVKNAVKGQYGQNSAEFASVKGIRW